MIYWWYWFCYSDRDAWMNFVSRNYSHFKKLMVWYKAVMCFWSCNFICNSIMLIKFHLLNMTWDLMTDNFDKHNSNCILSAPIVHFLQRKDVFLEACFSNQTFYCTPNVITWTFPKTVCKKVLFCRQIMKFLIKDQICDVFESFLLRGCSITKVIAVFKVWQQCFQTR